MVHVLREYEDASGDQVAHQVLAVGVEDVRHQSAASLEVRAVVMLSPGLDQVLKELEHSCICLLRKAY